MIFATDLSNVMAVLLEAADHEVPAEPHSVRKILVAYDGTPEAGIALERGIAMALEHSALLTIAGVVPEPRLYSGIGPLMLPFSPATLKRDAEREVCRVLAAARDEVPADVSVTTQLLHGHCARAIAKLANCGDYDVVVTPRPSHRLRRLLRT
jgi:nucleotide-binding universal stress UspA family protein